LVNIVVWRGGGRSMGHSLPVCKCITGEAYTHADYAHCLWTGPA